MTPARRKQLRVALNEMISRLTDQGPRKIEPTATDDVERPDSEDDRPLAEMLQSITSNRNANDARVVGLCRAALQRMDDDADDFGNCQECGDEIPAARLKVMPYATHCVGCQSKKDPLVRGSRKKLTDFS